MTTMRPLFASFSRRARRLLALLGREAWLLFTWFCREFYGMTLAAAFFLLLHRVGVAWPLAGIATVVAGISVGAAVGMASSRIWTPIRRDCRCAECAAAGGGEAGA